MKKLPPEFVVLGDAAYEPSEELVPMYFGVGKKQEDCDNFNYYASQCRIRIEMAFGLMYNRWGILWRPLRVKMENLKYVMMAIALLHNYTINERLLFELENNEDADIYNLKINDTPQVSTGTGFCEPTPSTPEYDTITRSKAKDIYLKGHSFIRESMNERIKILNIKRPITSRTRIDNSNLEKMT